MAETENSGPRVLIAGGGTGGHLFPALAIRDAIHKLAPNASFAFVGTKRGLEFKVFRERSEKLYTLWLSGFRRDSKLQNLGALFKLLLSILQTLLLLLRFRPNLVIGTGGYVMGPVLFFAQRIGIPTLLQEQNSLPGLTTRKLASRASAVCIAFEDARKRLNTEQIYLTGNPVRASFQALDKVTALENWGLMRDRTTLLFVGGSQGAKSVNEALGKCLEELLEEYSIIWQTGRGGLPKNVNPAFVEDCERQNVLRVKPFIDDMPGAYSAADLAICRAGAMTIAELAICGLPAIFVPFPFASDDHQTVNAQSLVQVGAAMMIPDRDLTSDNLLQSVGQLTTDKTSLTTMSEAMRRFAKPTAAEDIAWIALNLLSS